MLITYARELYDAIISIIDRWRFPVNFRARLWISIFPNACAQCEREREKDTIAANALAAREISPNAERILRTVFCARVLCWRLSRQLLFNFVYYGMRARLVFNLG